MLRHSALKSIRCFFHGMMFLENFPFFASDRYCHRALLTGLISGSRQSNLFGYFSIRT